MNDFLGAHERAFERVVEVLSQIDSQKMISGSTVDKKVVDISSKSILPMLRMLTQFVTADSIFASISSKNKEKREKIISILTFISSDSSISGTDQKVYRTVLFLLYEFIKFGNDSIVSISDENKEKIFFLLERDIKSDAGSRMYLSYRYFGCFRRLLRYESNILISAFEKLSIPIKTQKSFLAIGGSGDKDYQSQLLKWNAVLSAVRRARMPISDYCIPNLFWSLQSPLSTTVGHGLGIIYNEAQFPNLNRHIFGRFVEVLSSTNLKSWKREWDIFNISMLLRIVLEYGNNETCDCKSISAIVCACINEFLDATAALKIQLDICNMLLSLTRVDVVDDVLHKYPDLFATCGDLLRSAVVTLKPNDPGTYVLLRCCQKLGSAYLRFLPIASKRTESVLESISQSLKTFLFVWFNASNSSKLAVMNSNRSSTSSASLITGSPSSSSVPRKNMGRSGTRVVGTNNCLDSDTIISNIHLFFGVLKSWLWCEVRYEEMLVVFHVFWSILNVIESSNSEVGVPSRLILDFSVSVFHRILFNSRCFTNIPCTALSPHPGYSEESLCFLLTISDRLLVWLGKRLPIFVSFATQLWQFLALAIPCDYTISSILNNENVPNSASANNKNKARSDSMPTNIGSIFDTLDILGSGSVDNSLVNASSTLISADSSNDRKEPADQHHIVKEIRKNFLFSLLQASQGGHFSMKKNAVPDRSKDPYAISDDAETKYVRLQALTLLCNNIFLWHSNSFLCEEDEDMSAMFRFDFTSPIADMKIAKDSNSSTSTAVFPIILQYLVDCLWRLNDSLSFQHMVGNLMDLAVKLMEMHRVSQNVEWKSYCEFVLRNIDFSLQQKSSFGFLRAKMLKSIQYIRIQLSSPSSSDSIDSEKSVSNNKHSLSTRQFCCHAPHFFEALLLAKKLRESKKQHGTSTSNSMSRGSMEGSPLDNNSDLFDFFPSNANNGNIGGPQMTSSFINENLLEFTSSLSSAINSSSAMTTSTAMMSSNSFMLHTPAKAPFSHDFALNSPTTRSREGSMDLMVNNHQLRFDDISNHSFGSFETSMVFDPMSATHSSTIPDSVDAFAMPSSFSSSAIEFPTSTSGPILDSFDPFGSSTMISFSDSSSAPSLKTNSDTSGILSGFDSSISSFADFSTSHSQSPSKEASSFGDFDQVWSTSSAPLGNNSESLSLQNENGSNSEMELSSSVALFPDGSKNSSVESSSLGANHPPLSSSSSTPAFALPKPPPSRRVSILPPPPAKKSK